jgi:hypothetical protein
VGEAIPETGVFLKSAKAEALKREKFDSEELFKSVAPHHGPQADGMTLSLMTETVDDVDAEELILAEASEDANECTKEVGPSKENPCLAHTTTTDPTILKFLKNSCLKDVNGKVEGGFNALHIAARGGLTDVTLKLLASDVFLGVNAETDEGMSALSVAALHGKRGVVEVLLDSSRFTALGGALGAVTPIHAAAHSGNVDVVEVLLRHHRIDSSVLKRDMAESSALEGVDWEQNKRGAAEAVVRWFSETLGVSGSTAANMAKEQALSA